MEEFMRTVEMALDDLSSRMGRVEAAVTAIPQLNLETDPSKLPGVVIGETAKLAPETPVGL